jgi:hypothetical protein
MGMFDTITIDNGKHLPLSPEHIELLRPFRQSVYWYLRELDYQTKDLGKYMNVYRIDQNANLQVLEDEEFVNHSFSGEVEFYTYETLQVPLSLRELTSKENHEKEEYTFEITFNAKFEKGLCHKIELLHFSLKEKEGHDENTVFSDGWKLNSKRVLNLYNEYEIPLHKLFEKTRDHKSFKHMLELVDHEWAYHSDVLAFNRLFYIAFLRENQDKISGNKAILQASIFKQLDRFDCPHRKTLKFSDVYDYMLTGEKNEKLLS